MHVNAYLYIWLSLYGKESFIISACYINRAIRKGYYFLFPFFFSGGRHYLAIISIIFALISYEAKDRAVNSCREEENKQKGAIALKSNLLLPEVSLFE